jgi:hypothetical protein
VARLLDGRDQFRIDHKALAAFHPMRAARAAGPISVDVDEVEDSVELSQF